MSAAPHPLHQPPNPCQPRRRSESHNDIGLWRYSALSKQHPHRTWRRREAFAFCSAKKPRFLLSRCELRLRQWGNSALDFRALASVAASRGSVGGDIIIGAADYADIMACSRSTIHEVRQKLTNCRLVWAKELTDDDDSRARIQSLREPATSNLLDVSRTKIDFHAALSKPKRKQALVPCPRIQSYTSVMDSAMRGH